MVRQGPGNSVGFRVRTSCATSTPANARKVPFRILSFVYGCKHGSSAGIDAWIRSLKLFFVMKMYGAQALRGFVRHHISIASHFASLVKADDRLELAAPPRFGLVCFRLRDAPRQAQINLLDAVNASGHMFLTHTELSGQYTLRLAVGSPGTQLKHVMEAWDAVNTAAGTVLARYPPVSEPGP